MEAPMTMGLPSAAPAAAFGNAATTAIAGKIIHRVPMEPPSAEQAADLRFGLDAPDSLHRHLHALIERSYARVRQWFELELAELSRRVGPGHDRLPAQMAPFARIPSIRAAEYPSERSTASVCCPSEGTAPMAASIPSRLAGGNGATMLPTLVSTSRQRLRAASWGCCSTSAISFSRPFAMPAASSRKATASALRPAKASSMK